MRLLRNGMPGVYRIDASTSCKESGESARMASAPACSKLLGYPVSAATRCAVQPPGPRIAGCKGMVVAAYARAPWLCASR